MSKIDTKYIAEKPKVRGKAIATLEVDIRKDITKAIWHYFRSDQFREDLSLGGKNGNSRFKIHFDLLPYALSKKENLKTMIQNMSENELSHLVNKVKSQL